MPELPEVETVARGLLAGLTGRRVEAVEVFQGDRLFPSPVELAEGLTGRTFRGVRRVGKHLFCDLDEGLTLAGHLRMTGQLRVQPSSDERLKHTHLVARLDDGHEFRWRDVRRFGWLHLVPTDDCLQLPSLAGAGPDALVISPDELSDRIRGSKRMMKALLLGQDVVSGLGNIYADEVLWRARIHPRQRSDRLSRPRLRLLYDSMQALLTEAIAARGSSIDGNYVAADGFRGGFQNQLAVYGRAGLPAPCCGRPVRRIVVNSRSTHYCPHCQRHR